MANIGIQQGAVGKQVGQVPVASAGEFGEVLVSELMARYYEQNYRGNLFGVGYTAAALAAPSATASGSFTLYNPLNSGKNLVLLEITTSLTTWTVQTTTSPAIGVYTFANQTPTALTPGNTPLCALIGSGNASVAKTYTAATIVGGNTFPIRQVANFAVATAVGAIELIYKDEVAGALILTPGNGFGLAATATAASDTIQVAYTWTEIPV
jgi:hypothetical protein